MAKQQNTTNGIRRKLLKAVVYAPPVILGSMVATPRTVMGGGIGQPKDCTGANGGPNIPIVISSGTNACCPCVPGTKDFIKDLANGGLKCETKQCLKSCGANCTPAAIQKIVNNGDCDKFCQTCGAMPASMAGACNCSCTPGAPNEC